LMQDEIDRDHLFYFHHLILLFSLSNSSNGPVAQVLIQKKILCS